MKGGRYAILGGKAKAAKNRIFPLAFLVTPLLGCQKELHVIVRQCQEVSVVESNREKSHLGQ
jgi:hypothetical protein